MVSARCKLAYIRVGTIMLIGSGKISARKVVRRHASLDFASYILYIIFKNLDFSCSKSLNCASNVQNKRARSMELEFAQTVREHKGTIYTVCYMFSNNPDEVADLFQEILINLWKGFLQFRGDSNVKTWIYRVSLNTCISSERKKSRKVETLPLTMDINLFSDSDDDTKQVQLLRDRINKLGPFDRAIVLLWLENLSYDEIGAIVGISAKNVSVRLVRIKDQLKKMSNE